MLQHAGRPEPDARRIALSLLPDMLSYDPSADGGDPNGHTLTSGAVDAALAMMSNGAVTTDLVGPHDELFPASPTSANRTAATERDVCGMDCLGDHVRVRRPRSRERPIRPRAAVLNGAEGRALCHECQAGEPYCPAASPADG